MALTYNIRFKRELKEKNELKELQKNTNDDIISISDLLTIEEGFIDGYFEDQDIELDFGNRISIVSIDILKKDISPEKKEALILNIVNKIVNEIYPDEDYYFDFNGDIIHEMRIEGIVKKNSKSALY